MGWTGKEIALSIRGIVQRLQNALGDLPRTGKYDRVTHLKLFALLAANGRGAGLDTAGPDPIEIIEVFPEVFDETQASYIRTAWAWWAQKRVRPIPAGAQAAILDANTVLHAAGSMVLTPKDADEFVGDAPVVTVMRASLAGLGVLLVIGVFVLGQRWGRSECQRALSAPPTGWRR